VGLIYSFAGSFYFIDSYLDVSGAHFNPAVTFAAMVVQKTSLRKGLLYIFVQLIASLVSTALLYGIFPNMDPKLLIIDYEKNSHLAIQYHQAFLLETLSSFILSFVIFATAFETGIFSRY
jgi:glycerol uptake facilitator-like aquaporin